MNKNINVSMLVDTDLLKTQKEWLISQYADDHDTHFTKSEMESHNANIEGIVGILDLIQDIADGDIKQSQLPSVEWAETHYEIAAMIETELGQTGRKTNPFLTRMYEKSGRAAKWELAYTLTNKFQTIHAETQWDGEWLETLEDFFKTEINK